MPFLGLMGCKRFIQLSQRRLCGSKLAPAPICGHILPLGPCARRRWTSAEKQQILAPESTAARVGDGMAEWSACEPIADVATVGLERRLFELT
jgi:hypothetical protein